MSGYEIRPLSAVERRIMAQIEVARKEEMPFFVIYFNKETGDLSLIETAPRTEEESVAATIAAIESTHQSTYILLVALPESDSFSDRLSGLKPQTVETLMCNPIIDESLHEKVLGILRVQLEATIRAPKPKI